jgi:hypothetical protein
MKKYSEDWLIQEHIKEGNKRYGKKRMDNCNLGWYMEDRSICSKVYGDPCMILSTYYKNGEFYHDEEEY